MCASIFRTLTSTQWDTSVKFYKVTPVPALLYDSESRLMDRIPNEQIRILDLNIFSIKLNIDQHEYGRDASKKYKKREFEKWL